MHLLDTDVVIWHLRNKSEIVALVESLSQAGRLGISALTRLEVGVGVKERERSSTQEFLAALKTYEVSGEIADMSAEFIDLSLVTLNIRHYPMPEVRLYFESR